MREAGSTEIVVVEVALHREHLGHRVRDRRAGREDDVAATGGLTDDARLHVEVGGLLASFRVAEACDVAHTGGVAEVLELVSLVQKQPVDTQIVPVEAVVLAVGVEELFQLLFHPLATVLALFDVAGFFALCGLDRGDGRRNVRNLLPDELRLGLRMNGNLAEGAVRDDNHIPVAGGDTGEEAFAVGCFEILLRRG